MSPEPDYLSRRVAGKSSQPDPESWQIDPMLGAPMIPPDEWSFWPYSSWTFSHVSEYTRTARVWRGPGPVLLLPQRLRDIGDIEIASRDGRRATIREYLERDYTDGFLVLHRGEIVFETYMNGMEPHLKHIARSGSKSITGTVFGILVHRGLVDPENLVTRYLPELKATAYRGATVQHLLDMTAGATLKGPWYVPDTDYFNYIVASGYFGPPEAHPEAPADVWQAILRITEQEAPHGARFAYFDPNIDVLGLIMQRVTGKFLPELYSSELWGPMGAEEDACQIVDKSRFSMSSGGFQATLRDFARFALLHLRRGRLNGTQIVPSEWIEATRRPKPVLFESFGNDASSYVDARSEFPNGAYHNTFWIEDQERGAYVAWGYGGQLIYIDPEADFAAVKLSHQPGQLPVKRAQWPNQVYQAPKPLPFDSFAAFRAIRDELES
ncbi:MAG: serine hydrolase [Mesorhizobium sp.]|uniref:serine hydrolase domain-containing protein n=1 Tax=unclassified Mesorhizobium TaxID=325217 RepID=UPI000F764C32|nr:MULTISPECIES: serine hydrolase [unclassified Mesorhizobium]AZO50313.1 class C beta-lactamase-related serine hydrolase [Mesorhizobium sp. M4B.F.Ca.ET.058.02.1.1]RWD38333.1 MAG: class C beta-lactamase-related serine hydrolase [Mesorhizobium sp.]TIW13202.1 MAG: serine hydrolase [Mesorhizobium sp.]TIW37408.1 MAG: serine hydrolase [Mesorhizobium sp.]